MEEYELQPLRINSGWTVELNNFYNCEPDSCISFAHYFIEDILQLTNSRFNLIIDLGWYPAGDDKGLFQLILIKNYNWENPLGFFESKNTKAIVDKIEYWTNCNFFQKYI